MKARLVLATFGVAAVCALVFVPLLAQSPSVRTFTSVTDAMLRNPSPDDWLNWRRTLDGWGYSSLNQINRQNVGQLQLAWSWAMQPGSNQATPLVHDGVMYSKRWVRSRQSCAAGWESRSALFKASNAATTWR